MPIPQRIIIEMAPLGNSVKVSAICEDTGREVSFVGPATAGKAELESLAVKKLTYVMTKDDEKTPSKRGFEV